MCKTHLGLARFMYFLTGGENMANHTYSAIAEFRKAQIKSAARDHFKLNELHDNLIKQVLEISLQEVLARYGPPPSPF